MFESWTAPTSTDGATCFETGNDFDASAHFTYGLAITDDEGNFKPTFSVGKHHHILILLTSSLRCQQQAMLS